MRWRQVIVLYAVLAALGLLYGWERPQRRPDQPVRPARARFLPTAAADVTHITLMRGGRTVRVRRDGDEWTVVEPAGSALPRDLVTGFLQALLTTEEIDRIAPDPENPGAFGLGGAADRVELTLTNGAPVVVALGAPNPTGTALYASRAGDAGIILIGRQVRDYQDLIFNALPRGAVPAGAPEGRIGRGFRLLLNRARV